MLPGVTLTAPMWPAVSCTPTAVAVPVQEAGPPAPPSRHGRLDWPLVAAGDNAAMESFFALLQKNVLNRRVWATREQLRIAIVTWIERTYHRRRRQARIGRFTPVEYEVIMTTTATQAA